MAAGLSIAVIADVHGNRWALAAVLADIQKRGIQQIINLGDSVFGTLDPAGTAELLIEHRTINIRGNQERDVFDPVPAMRASSDFAFVTRQLNEQHLAWLRAHQPTYATDTLFCCHGTPTSDSTYLLEKVTPHGVLLADTESILAALGSVTQPVILCGHSHVPRTVWLPGDRLVVNPGSVGIPAYDHDVPYPHVMEAGSPHARYAVITQQPNGFGVEQIAVTYPWATAAAATRRNGGAHRAPWLESGRAKLDLTPTR
jgi:predicted phosphodiesterase